MTIKLKIGNNFIEKDGLKATMDVAPFLQNDRTFVPVRFVSEALGFDVEWDEKNETVTIKDKVRYFKTVDQCAIDWAMRHNNLSIGLHKELGSSIYHCEKGYYYLPYNTRTSNEASFPLLPGTEGLKSRVALIHSHASTGNGTQKADKVSSGDIADAKKWKIDNYIATPCGTLLVYRFGTGKTETISDLLPYDRRAKDKLEGPWKYGKMEKNDAFFELYNVGKTSDEADAYNYLFSKKLLFPFVD